MAKTRSEVMGKVVQLSWVDTAETVTGICGKGYKTQSLYVTDRSGRSHSVDSLSQLKVIGFPNF